MQQTPVPCQPAVITLPHSQQTPRLNIPVVRGLSIVQIAFGPLTTILGIVSTSAINVQEYWVNSSGSGIWFGAWILITGIIGVYSAYQPQNRALNGVNMGFNIVCTTICFFVGVFFVIALDHYSTCQEYYYSYHYWQLSKVYNYSCQNKTTGTVIYAILLVLMIVEFFVSLIISIYCCLGTGCCATQTRGVVIQQPFVTTGMITTSNAVYHNQTAHPPQVMIYPVGSVASAPSYQQPMYQQIQNQIQQGMLIQAPLGTSTTATTYSSDPPPYSTVP